MTVLRRYNCRPVFITLLVSVIQYQILGQYPQVVAQSTPVIGGPCKLGTADVQIGGKQTQFFLHCEADDSSSSDGIWVVKSRLSKSEQITTTPQQAINHGQTYPNVQPQQKPYPQYPENQPMEMHQKKHVKMPTAPIICEQNLQARENAPCSVPETCLQQSLTDVGSYLQCNPATHKWIKKHCQQGFAFNFEHQSCIGHPKTFRQHVARQPANTGGLVCTYSQCSQSNPCSSGSCNNGYCCSSALSGSSNTAPMSIAGTIGHNQMKQFNNKSFNPVNILALADDWTIPPGASLPHELAKLDTMLVKAAGDGSSCAAGFTSNLRCTSFGQCPPGLFCDMEVKLCCPLLLPLSEVTITPPTTHAPVRSTYRHYNNNNQLQHYPSRYSKIPPGSRFAPSSSQQSMHSEESFNGIAKSFNQQRKPMHQFPCPRCNNMFSYVCPNGAQPYGSCNGGACATGYQCMPATNLCCPTTPQPIVSSQPLYAGCPGGGTSGGSCVGGQCGSGFSCNNNNVCCAQVVPATVCPDGTQAAGACVNNMCGMGFLCNQGLCCTNTSQTPRCLDGSQAIGACMQGKCGTGYTCTTGNVCCPSTLNSCPNGQTSIGACVNGRCPDGYTCINNQCCGPPANAQNQVTCDRLDSNGPCIAPDNTCPEPGYSCDTANNWCCPMIMGNAVGPCITGAGGTRLCPEGYACSGAGVGNCFRLNTGTCAPEDQFGPCGTGNPPCPPGFTCIGGFCCKDTATKRRKRSFLEYI